MAKQINNVDLLKKLLTKILKKDEPAAVCAIMQWLHVRDHAVCIFTPKELESTMLDIDDVESAMCSSGDDAMRFNPALEEDPIVELMDKAKDTKKATAVKFPHQRKA